MYALSPINVTRVGNSMYARVLMALLLIQPLAAWSETLADPAVLLQRVYAASQKLSYAGVFVYQHGGTSETSRITRLVENGVKREKLEALDGHPREVVRDGDELICYFPATNTVRIDKQPGQRGFPSILPGHLRDLAESYSIRRGDVERVAGFDCQVLILEPKDNMRYAHRLWVEPQSGMIIKARTMNERGEVMEQFAFTQLQIGGTVDRERVRSSFAGKTASWRVEDATVAAANLAESGWILRSRPPGFRKIGEMRRTLGGATGVGHMVLSDGLAAISVFIEPTASRPVQNEWNRQGAINVYIRQVADFKVTVLGEAPLESMRYIAHALEYRKPQ